MLHWRLQPEWTSPAVLLTQALVLLAAQLVGQRSGWLLALAAVGLLGIWAWLSRLRRARAILDTPTARVASAAQGMVELMGRGRPLPERPLLSPMTRLPCLWYRYALYRRVNDRWQLEERGQSDQPFLLEDDSGVCEIDPEGAEIHSNRTERRRTGDRKYTETLLIEGDPLYALGEFRTLGGAHLALDPRADLDALLSEWKSDPEGLRARFDRDGDRQISQAEWQQAVQAAREAVRERHFALRQMPPRHSMRKPSRGGIYLISNLDPQRLGRRFAGLAWLHLASSLGAWFGLVWLLRQPG